MLIKEYVKTVRSLYGESDLIDGDLSFDERFLNSVPIDQNVYHVLRERGTIIFEESQTSSPYLKVVINYYAGTDETPKCNKITKKTNGELSVEPFSIMDVLSLIEE